MGDEKGLNLGLPRIGIGGRFGIYAEIPDVEIHSFFSQYFDDRVLTRLKTLGRSEFEPSSCERRGGGFDEMLLLRGFASDLPLHVSQNAFTHFYFGAHNAVAIGGCG